MAKKQSEQGNPALVVAGAALIVLVASWVIGARSATEWAIRNGYFSDINPAFAVPGAIPSGAGPTLLATLGVVAVLSGIAAAAVIAYQMLAAPIQRDPDDRRPLPPVLTPLVAATGTTAGAIIMIFIPFLPSIIVAAGGIFTAAFLGDWLLSKLREMRDRARYLNEIEWAIYLYLGFDELPRKRIVAIAEWDPATEDRPEKPKTIKMVYKGHREDLKPELNRRLDDAVGGSHYDLSYATTDQVITAELASVNTEPQLVRDLRDQLIRPSLFKPGATLHNPVISEAGSLLKFEVHHQIGADLSGSDQLRTIEHKISGLLDGRWRTTQTNHLAGTVTFEIRPELPTKVYPPTTKPVLSVAEACERYDGAVIPLAIDEYETLIEWNLKLNPHCLLMGPTGTGKTGTINNMIMGAAPLGARIFIIDFKGGEFTHMRDYPGVVSVVTEPFEAIALINIIYKEMQGRYNLYKKKRSSLANKEPFLIIIDEYTEFQDILRRFYALTKPKGGPRDCPTLTQFSSLLRLGRTCRLHCVAAMQRADQKFLEGEAKDNFTMRLSLGRLSTQAAIMIHNDAYAGRTVPLGIRGRGTALNKIGVPTEVQSFYVPDPEAPTFSDDDRRILAELRPPVRLYERGIIMPPQTNPVLEPEEFPVYQNLPLLKASEYPGFDPLSPDYAPPGWLEVQDRGVDSIFGAPPDDMTPSTPTELVHTVYESDDTTRDVAIVDLDVGAYVRNPNTGEWGLLHEEPMPGDDPETTALILRDNFDGTLEECQIPSNATVEVREIPETHLASV
ncbi:FtsK/SpoIIIE domain-containing protein [Mycolicibacterium senegalense]|uniref:FtsK/SpoIIIE domain-containing protein n=1 Tax=Mycolicibacterium senegalense TaxID=1796 RepID=UPI003AAA8125